MFYYEKTIQNDYNFQNKHFLLPTDYYNLIQNFDNECYKFIIHEKNRKVVKTKFCQFDKSDSFNITLK